jgi:CRISPR/Cas system CSM-associated protein Csm3 (group 7 of RAMP superfamily)
VNSYNIKLTLRLRTEKKLLVSSGMADLSPHADICFMKTRYRGEVKLIIPGSTFKGVLRTSLVRTAELLGYQGVEKSVYPSRVGGPEDLVCKIFGRPHGPASKVSVKSIYLPNTVQRLTHVKIKDSCRVAEQGGIFTAEYLPIGMDFDVVIRGEELTMEEAEALFVALANLRWERIGRAGIIDIGIDVRKSEIPEMLVKGSEIINHIVEVMGHESL